MSTEEQKPDNFTNDTGSQSGSAAVQRGGAGMEKTPADSDTPQDPSKTINTTSVSNDVPDFATQKPGGNPGILEGIRDDVDWSAHLIVRREVMRDLTNGAGNMTKYMNRSPRDMSVKFVQIMRFAPEKCRTIIPALCLSQANNANKHWTTFSQVLLGLQPDCVSKERHCKIQQRQKSPAEATRPSGPPQPPQPPRPPRRLSTITTRPGDFQSRHARVAMAPPAKKQKPNDGAPLGPIVFRTTGGLEQDVRLNVFGQEFHVHSCLLKAHSAFFSRFLDSSEKRPAAESAVTNGRYRYEWVTEVDENGDSWYLTSDSATGHQVDFAGYKTSQLFEQGYFHKLLCAVYGHTYELTGLKELKAMVSLADYYCMLPTFSRSLDVILLRSSKHGINMRHQCRDVFPLAAKLRNKLLFTESLIWLTGPFSNPAYKALKDPKLKKIAHYAYLEVSAKVTAVHRESVSSNRKNLLSTSYSMYLPEYYRMWKDEFGGMQSLKALMQNNLRLSPNEKAGGDVFLCAEIDDADLPWDVNEVDWSPDPREVLPSPERDALSVLLPLLLRGTLSQTQHTPSPFPPFLWEVVFTRAPDHELYHCFSRGSHAIIGEPVSAEQLVVEESRWCVPDRRVILCNRGAPKMILRPGVSARAFGPGVTMPKMHSRKSVAGRSCAATDRSLRKEAGVDHSMSSALSPQPSTGPPRSAAGGSVPAREHLTIPRSEAFTSTGRLVALAAGVGRGFSCRGRRGH
ncbi:unnamed protein product [Diplocarpon coronariae]